MNLDQMEYRCPNAKVVENVRLDDYHLAFCGSCSGCGVATVFPEKGSYVEGVLWEITPECEQRLDRYEGYPHVYEKETIRVRNQGGMQMDVMVYIMNSPYKDSFARPSNLYLNGIIDGCRQNGIPEKPVLEAVKWRGKKSVEKKRNHKDSAR